MSLDLSKPVRTREGRPARIVATDRKGTQYPVVAFVIDLDGHEYITTHTKSGKISAHTLGAAACGDLVNVPNRVQGSLWLNVYRPEEKLGICAYATRELADEAQARSVHRVACIELKYDVEEGTGL